MDNNTSSRRAVTLRVLGDVYTLSQVQIARGYLTEGDYTAVVYFHKLGAVRPFLFVRGTGYNLTAALTDLVANCLQKFGTDAESGTIGIEHTGP